LAQR
jgi:hypothetical protein